MQPGDPVHPLNRWFWVHCCSMQTARPRRATRQKAAFQGLNQVLLGWTYLYTSQPSGYTLGLVQHAHQTLEKLPKVQHTWELCKPHSTLPKRGSVLYSAQHHSCGMLGSM